MVLFRTYLFPLVQNGHPTVASECIQLYFSLDPPANQFLIRAHLCEGLIAAPSNPSDEESWVSNKQCCIEPLIKLVFNLPLKKYCIESLKNPPNKTHLVHNVKILL